MPIKDDELTGEFVLETVNHGKLAHETIRYTDFDEPVLQPPPYDEDPAVDVHEKLLPQLPSYEEAEDDDDEDDDDDIREDRKDFICRIIIRTIIILFCFYVVVSVILHALDGLDPNLTEDDRIARPWPERPKWPPLNFVETFPELDVALSSSECRTAWNKLTAVPCSSYIWSSDWDEGDHQASAPYLTRLISETCEEACTTTLRRAHESLGSNCAGQAAFKIDGYKGRISTKFLDLGPSKIVELLVQRTAYVCRKSQSGDAERGLCLVDLSSRWGIADGVLADGFAGLKLFMDATKVERKETANRVKGLGRWTKEYKSVEEERRFGPRKNSTTCSWCTLNWFENKLALWKPETYQYNDLARLPHFLRMWEKGGRRCEGNDFEKIFNSAVQTYKDSGLLLDDWEYEGSGRTEYLVEHGPSSSDFPLGFAKQTITTVKTYREAHGSTPLIPSLDPTDDRTGSLEDEFISCLEAFVAEAQDLPCYPFLHWNQIKQYIFSSPDIAREACSEACFSAIDTLRQKVQDACPSTKYFGTHVYDNILPVGPQFGADKFPTFLSSIKLADYFGDPKDPSHVLGSLAGYRASCTRAGVPGGLPCGAIFANWERAEWIFGDCRVAKIADVIRITQLELRKLPEIPKDLGEWKEPVGRPVTIQETETHGQLADWQRAMEESLCSTCMWRLFVPQNRTAEHIQCLMPGVADGEEIANDWIKTMHLLMRECAARRVEFPKQEAAEVDAAWILLNSQERFEKAMSENLEITH